MRGTGNQVSEAGPHTFRLFGLWTIATLNYCHDRHEARKLIRWYLRPFVSVRLVEVAAHDGEMATSLPGSEVRTTATASTGQSENGRST